MKLVKVSRKYRKVLAKHYRNYKQIRRKKKPFEEFGYYPHSGGASTGLII